MEVTPLCNCKKPSKILKAGTNNWFCGLCGKKGPQDIDTQTMDFNKIDKENKNEKPDPSDGDMFITDDF
jgi:hypothetical protein